MNLKKLGQAMSLIERTYHNSDMGYWFEDAPELFDESNYASEEFDEKYPVFLAEKYQETFEADKNNIDKTLENFLDDTTLFTEIIKEAPDKNIIKALKTVQEYIKPEDKSHKALQELIHDAETLPLLNMKCALEVMSEYMLDVKNFGTQSNDFGTIGKLEHIKSPTGFQKYLINYLIKTKISPNNMENCGSRGIAIFLSFMDDMTVIEFDVVNQQYLNEAQTVVGFGKTLKILTTKEYHFTGHAATDKEKLKEIICLTLEECKSELEEYVEANPNGSPIPYEGK